MGKILEHDETNYFNRRELQAYVEVMNENLEMVESDNEAISNQEQVILKGVMESATTNVGSIMTPLDKVFQLKEFDCINRDLRVNMWIKGHSRIPVLKENTINYILLKDIIILPENLVIKDFPDIFVKKPI